MYNVSILLSTIIYLNKIMNKMNRLSQNGEGSVLIKKFADNHRLNNGMTGSTTWCKGPRRNRAAKKTWQQQKSVIIFMPDYINQLIRNRSVIHFSITLYLSPQCRKSGKKDQVLSFNIFFIFKQIFFQEFDLSIN